MPRPIWKGDISFGLVNIPVALYTAESHQCDVKLRWVDKRDLSPIGYSKINKNTGQKVPNDQLIEAYEYEKGEYVLLTREELKKIHPVSDQSIEILEFVDGSDIQPEYFDRPYYLEPTKKSKRGYVLLREVLRDSGKVGIAKVIIRTRQYLAALFVEGNSLLLEILRFPCELIDANKLDLPKEKMADLGIKKKEKEIATELVNSMSDKWDPSKYANDYQGNLLDYIMGKIKLKGRSAIKELKTEATVEKKGKVIDLMELLKKSVESAKGKKRKSPAARKTATTTKRKTKKTA